MIDSGSGIDLASLDSYSGVGSNSNSNLKKRVLIIGDAQRVVEYAPVPKTPNAVGVAWWYEVWDGKAYVEEESGQHDLLPLVSPEEELQSCVDQGEFEKADIIFVFGDALSQLFAQNSELLNRLLSAGKDITYCPGVPSSCSAWIFIVAKALERVHEKKLKFTTEETESISALRVAARSKIEAEKYKPRKNISGQYIEVAVCASNSNTLSQAFENWSESRQSKPTHYVSLRPGYVGGFGVSAYLYGLDFLRPSRRRVNIDYLALFVVISASDDKNAIINSITKAKQNPGLKTAIEQENSPVVFIFDGQPEQLQTAQEIAVKTGIKSYATVAINSAANNYQPLDAFMYQEWGFTTEFNARPKCEEIKLQENVAVSEYIHRNFNRARRTFCALSTTGLFAGSALGALGGAAGILGHMGIITFTPAVIAFIAVVSAAALALLIVGGVNCARLRAQRSPRNTQI